MQTFKAEIDIKYAGIELSINGNYDSEMEEFTDHIQILHQGADLDAIIDESVKSEIIDQAEKAYIAWLKAKNMEVQR